MTQKSAAKTSLKIVKTFSSPVSEVYKAWTQSDRMKQWMGPGEVTCKQVAIDLKVGGRYRIEMQTTDCENPIAIGEYKQIVPEQKLQFTWSWEGGPMPDTLVTLEFKEKNGGTELTLIHENFPDQETAGKHNEGWAGCLANLQKHVS